jgi:hypothetical protein
MHSTILEEAANASFTEEEPIAWKFAVKQQGSSGTAKGGGVITRDDRHIACAGMINNIHDFMRIQRMKMDDIGLEVTKRIIIEAAVYFNPIYLIGLSFIGYGAGV